MALIERRSLVAGIPLLVLAGVRGAQAQGVPANTQGGNIRKVTFPNSGLTMAGNLYLPPDFDANRKYPAIVVVHPWGGVKEQTSGLYAKRLAEQSFVTLAYDASHYGESGGEPRFFEDPHDRVRDIRSAVTYLSSHPQIDASRIGALGICAGGGYTIDEVQTDLRVRAVASVVAYDMGGAARDGIATAPVSYEERMKILASVGDQLTKEAGGPPLIRQLIPSKDQWTASTPNFFKEAYDYYLTSRGQHPNAANRYAPTSVGLHMAYFPFAQIETISPRPLLLIAGERAETRNFSENAYAKAKEPKELTIVPGASHFDLYDKPEYVTPAVAKLTDFFSRNLVSG